MSDLISRLSELRCQYNCFDENERNAYHTLSEAIKALSDVPDTNIGDTINRQAAIDALMPIYKSASLRNRNVFSTARKCMAAIEDLPSAQPEGWMERNKDRILQAGKEGREVEFRIGGRLFAIREKAQ